MAKSGAFHILKKCKKCDIMKPIGEYYKEKRTADGHRSACKACRDADRLKWRENNRERDLEALRSFQRRNRKKVNESARTWRIKNPEKAKAIAAASANTRRARKKSARGSICASDIRAIINLQDDECHYCGATLNGLYHIDHIIPLRLGGDNDRQNLQALCPPCNLSKGGKNPAEYEGKIGHQRMPLFDGRYIYFLLETPLKWVRADLSSSALEAF